MSDNSGQIQTNSQKPQSATSNAGSVSQVPIPAQIEADRYAAAVGGLRNKNRGLRFSKLIPSGPQSDQQGTGLDYGPTFDTGRS